MPKALLISLPMIDNVAPPGALGILGGICQKNNWEYDIVDFSNILRKNLSNNDYLAVENWLSFINSSLSSDIKDQIIDHWYNSVIKQSENYDLICISVFSYWSLLIARLVLDYQKTHKNVNDYKIVVGGNGIQSKFPDSGYLFDNWALSNNVVDYVIYGEAETPFENLLNNLPQSDGINNKNIVQAENLDLFPYPEYKKFNLNDYIGNKLYITGSRGCVRRCTFCDIQNIWPKFRYRSAKNIINEIKKHYYETGITKYDFTDSLINGSSSNFYQFNCLLAEEKQKNKYLNDITYIGQAIVRPQNQMPESHYEAMHHAGCEQLTIGIESFSESVRNHMRKKFSNQDIEYHARMSSYWNIKNIWLMIVGYPTETLEDHNENLKGLEEFQKYAKQGVIEMIRWGTSMHLIEDTPITDPDFVKKLELKNNINYENLTSRDNWHYNWISLKNPSLDLRERLRRRMEIHFKSIELGYPQPRLLEELKTISSLADNIV